MTNNKAGWNFDNSYERLPRSLFSVQEPTPVRSPKLVLFNEELAKSLGLNRESLHQSEGLDALAGNAIPNGDHGLAQAYAGHQFGNFTMLGDGRALLLGEQVTPQGDRFDIQLKGSGRTAFSRGGDGRAALGPMLREYIISEAMHHLGIPTTRSLAVVSTGEDVRRETDLPGAILTRVAASHLRVGTFQYAAGRGDIDDLKALADYAINRHYPEAADAENPYLVLLQSVMKRQAELIASWQLVGFVHGVMNTDNTTISGETIDYGPCAFIDVYDPATVFSSIDVQGRYAYGNQPYMVNWNLARFAESLVPLLHDEQEQAVKLAQESIEGFKNEYLSHWFTGMRKKLGLFHEQDEDEAIIESLLKLMEETKADFTNTFRSLTFGKLEETELATGEEFADWKKQWLARLDAQAESKEEAQQLMKAHNPAVIPRNHRVEEALEAAVDRDDYTVANELLAVLADPYAHSKEQEAYANVPESCKSGYVTYCGT
ncbi:protein adenylyltransferase SelO [Bacillus sp. JCM 19041]|uniref:protein adenylyltransferase SelO n=1 Tax=Bacillus sp. JCM 19041 TaxID=1460637 RepID=UPI0006D03F7C